MERLKSHSSFGGRQEIWRHASHSTGTVMTFGLYLPPAALEGKRCPVLYWLSGLTCTEQNFITKAGAQAHAARHDLIVVVPDTSPRGDSVPNDAAFDLGQGAGFYLDATEAPWREHFRMESYVVDELPALIESKFPAARPRGLFGHSMGGMGAMVLALRHPGRYQSLSAFAPIVAPSQVPWGQKALAAYLGNDHAIWAARDPVTLIRQTASRLPILVDQGGDDEYLSEQLRPELLQAACREVGYPLTLNLRPGYDHSYYFIATFIGEHFAHHASALAKAT
jgi:S-formylglutathione hydrolase